MVTVAVGDVVEVTVDVCVLVIVNVLDTEDEVTYVLCQRVSFMEVLKSYSYRAGACRSRSRSNG